MKFPCFSRIRTIFLSILWLIVLIFLGRMISGTFICPLKYQMLIFVPFFIVLAFCEAGTLFFGKKHQSFVSKFSGTAAGISLLTIFLVSATNVVAILFIATFFTGSQFFLHRKSCPKKKPPKNHGFQLVFKRTGDKICGKITVFLQKNELQQMIHLPFCPVFDTLPTVMLNQVAGDEVQIEKPFVALYGMRFEVKRPSRFAETEIFAEIAFTA